jgi:hypothetical protein
LKKNKINPQTKLNVYRTVLEPILLYGSESWQARGRDICKITASEMKCLRRISHKTKRDLIRNQNIRDDLQQPPIEKRLAQRQLRWFGYLSRMNEVRKPRQFFWSKTRWRKSILNAIFLP